MTHAHWDHIGGLTTLAEPDTKVIAQARFADELQVVNTTGVPFRYFFGTSRRRATSCAPIAASSGPRH